LIPLDEIRAARERLGDDVVRTPLVQVDERIWLKLENLQPIGSYKLRGALNLARSSPRGDLVTASAGNMAQGVAWAARENGVHATVVAPESAPRAKLDAVERLGARVVLVSHEEWWQAMVDRGYAGADGLFVHPIDPAMMAGHGTAGLEVCEQLAEFDTVVIPWGSGGLTRGVASAVKGLRPGVRVVTAEPATAAPLAAAFAAGEPVEIAFEPSFVDGAGGRALLPTVWESVQGLVDEAAAVPLDDVEDAVRFIAARTRTIAEGAGALALAAAQQREDRCVCIVSGRR